MTNHLTINSSLTRQENLSLLSDESDDLNSKDIYCSSIDEINASTLIILHRKEPIDIYEFASAVKACIYDIEDVLNSLYGCIPYELSSDLENMKELYKLLISEFNRFREAALSSGLRTKRPSLSYGFGCGIGDFAKKAWNSVKNGAQTVLKTIKNVATGVTQFAKKAYNFVSEKVVTPIKNAAVSVFNATRDAAVRGWKTVTTTLSKWKGSIVGAWQNFWSNHGEKIKNFSRSALHFLAEESIKHITGHYLLPNLFSWLGFIFPPDDWFGTDSGGALA